MNENFKMDIQQLLQTLINGVLVVVVPVVANEVIQYVRTKTKGTKVEEAVDIVLDAVDQTNQTFADELRESGTVTEEKQKEALEKSLKTALSMMNDRMIKLLEKEFNNVEAWIVSKIEAACKANKSGNKSA